MISVVVLVLGMAGCGKDSAEGTAGTLDMSNVKTIVTDLLGDNYFPNMELDPEMLEFVTGITSDLYEEYFAEIPMISANVDTLIVVKAANGKADALEEAMNNYRNAQVGNTMQYPQNVGKVQASKVERIGDYVIFTMLGGDIGDVLDQGDEAVIAYCQGVNDSVIEAIREAMK